MSALFLWGNCQPWEAYIFVGLLACIGGLGLYFFFNALAAIHRSSLPACYTLWCTHHEKVSSLAVLVGAIPGALPPLIGAIAITGKLLPFESCFL